MSNRVIVGATSAMAEATARLWARQGDRLCLVGRDETRLTDMAADLTLRGSSEVTCHVADMTDTDSHEALVEALWSELGHVDTLLVAHGAMRDQSVCEASYEQAYAVLLVNGLSVISLLTPVANRMEAQGSGVIAVIGSVAGDRGRQSNYVYGSAKALVATFLSGLRNRLAHHGVHVVTIKPGFVDTPMTAGLPKGFLWAQPEAVAAGIVRAVARRRNVVYLPWFWRCIMLVIRSIPESIFKRLSL